ncbi:MAG: class I SAM-dependent rRNA methyltransferase [Acidobacteria bacterium]|nr:class I SAM-dependent rRNA methyltransferase [Acidobacteriota bacterium]
MVQLPTVRVSRRGADRVNAGHLWIYSSDVADRGEARPGDAVKVSDPKGRALGTAHFSSTSQICLRLLSTQIEPIDHAFFRRRITAAREHRERVVSGTDAYRLVYAEGDLLPALIVDRYGDYLAVQTLNQGMDRAKAEIAAVLEELFAPRGIVERNDAPVRKHEDLPPHSGVLVGEAPERIPVRMNGLAFSVDLLGGQKTGLFLDQRENYLAAARHARGQALDCFTSTGGFALHLAARCQAVEAVDSSAAVLAQAEDNRRLNHIENLSLREANVFDLLSGYVAAGRSFSTVVLDPPGFARSRDALEAARRGYKEINYRALRLLEPGGVLVTCSCSQHLSEAEFLEIVASASVDSGRRLRVLERRTQAQDHPILLTVPETHYLKCLILEVV